MACPIQDCGIMLQYFEEANRQPGINNLQENINQPSSYRVWALTGGWVKFILNIMFDYVSLDICNAREHQFVLV